MITLTVYHPTKEFFLIRGLVILLRQSLLTEGKQEPETVHVEDYPQGSYDGIIGLGSY